MKKQSAKCFPDTSKEYWLLMAAAQLGAIKLTEAGKGHMLSRAREWGNLVLCRGMPDWDEERWRSGFTSSVPDWDIRKLKEQMGIDEA